MQLSSLIGHTQEVLILIQKSTKPPDSLIDQFFRSHKYLGSHDRRFIAETLYGVLRHLRLCEWRLQGAVGNDLIAEDKASLLIAAFLLTVGKNTSVTATDILPRIKSPRVKEQLNGVLNSLQKDVLASSEMPGSRIGLRYSFPDWMVEKLITQWGDSETEKLCKSLNEQAPITIRVNTLKVAPDDCQKRLLEEGVDAENVRGIPFALGLKKRTNVFALTTFKEGLFEMQDAGSQLMPLLVDPKPTDKVLDACAGAGGKALEFSSLMKNRGEIVAADISKYRLEELRKRARRAGAFNIRPKHVDSLEDLAESYSEHFDVVFVDAPCTGVGTIRRNPGMKWSVSEEMVSELSEKQRNILQSCARLVKHGGRLAYATCSLFKDENEDVVKHFLTGNTGFSIEPTMNPLHGDKKVPTDFVYLLPHQSGTDGFFCCVMVKT